MFKRVLFLVFVLSVGFGCNASKKMPNHKKVGVHFEESDNLQDALKKAKKEGKLVFIDAYATWCGPCKMMEKDVFPNKDIAKLFNDNFVSIKTNVEKGEGVVNSINYDVKYLPTLLFLDTAGNVLERKDGVAYFTELRKLANAALEKEGK